ncbi:MAG: Yop proteins translocation protein K [Puniceicoccales bacterium]|jgi:hypothetical protein|nr:Yop proteins translocation protein K [Puniceicoccales bacterium]
MSETATDALKNILKLDFQFFRYWYDFHYNVVPRKDCDCGIGQIPKKAFDAMFASVPFRASIKRNILHKYGLEEQIDYRVDSPVLPLAMLRPETLSKLVPIVGALACFKDVNKVVEKKELGGIFDLVGNGVYTFVVKRSLLFWKKIPNLCENLPKVRLVKRLPMCGKSVFECATSSLPESVIKRMNVRSGIEFHRADGGAQEDIAKSITLIKYVLTNFFSNCEDAKLCLK